MQVDIADTVNIKYFLGRLKKKTQSGFIFGPLCMPVLHYLLIKENR